jgi:hypothetical protein
MGVARFVDSGAFRFCGLDGFGQSIEGFPPLHDQTVVADFRVQGQEVQQPPPLGGVLLFVKFKRHT